MKNRRTNPAAEQYLRRVESRLSTEPELRSKLLPEIRSSLAALVEENPQMDFDTLCELIGTPESLAESQLSTGGEPQSVGERIGVWLCGALLILLAAGAFWLFAGPLLFLIKEVLVLLWQVLFG